ncbi:MAG: hypothetical protein M3S32_08360 [Acidobacteriota bacterium]|nr:hypothetical protein [Acidobacteriota bacterium]
MVRNGYRTISGIVFGLIAIGQAIRAAMQVSLQVGTTAIPVWVSWVAVLVAGTLCIWAFRSPAENRRAA